MAGTVLESSIETIFTCSVVKNKLHVCNTKFTKQRKGNEPKYLNCPKYLNTSLYLSYYIGPDKALFFFNQKVLGPVVQNLTKLLANMMLNFLSWNMANALILWLRNCWYICHYYAPNFEEVGGAYCFWEVCACVRPSVHASVRYAFWWHSITSEPCMLGFWNFIYGVFMKKIIDTYFFPIRIMPLSWVMALWKNIDGILSAKYLKSNWS